MVNDSSLCHVVPTFYCVYVLQSIPKPRSFYIGSTPDPNRRLRQHNGELKRGGAYKTKRDGFRPWKVVMLIYNFPSKISALQFEHSLQHPYQTRHIDEINRVTIKKGTTSLQNIMANVRLLLTSNFFNPLDLKILICDDNDDQSLIKIWNINKYKIDIPNYINVDVQPLQEFLLDDKNSIKSNMFETLKQNLLKESSTCSICSCKIDYSPETVPSFKSKKQINEFRQQGNLRLIGACMQSECNSFFHLTCMAMKHTNDNSLIPKYKSCTVCNEDLDWLSVVKIATRLRSYLLRDSLND
ncbi:uncharacterized protein RJT21DRAFT_118281 [Scheffersomyces amazonensis]|uniref:uncharacterized protein n=1 Tax=Scheffersomyces amazonensis TaxID=1078765 RepID=UPI00315D1F08